MEHGAHPMKAEELLRESRDLFAVLGGLEIIGKIDAFLADPPRCKNCRWWDSETVHSFLYRGACCHESNGNEERLDGMGNTVQHGSYPEVWHDAESGPEFSCRHHEPRPAPDSP